MEEYYAALETTDDIWYNAADVHLAYSTASEGGGQFRNVAISNFQQCLPCYLSSQMYFLVYMAYSLFKALVLIL